MKRSSRHTRRAFTLIELLLALTLSVVVASVLAAALFATYKGKRSIDEALEATRTITIATDILAEELTRALPPTPIPENTLLQITGLDTVNVNLIGPFAGAADSVLFFASGPEPKASLQPDVRMVEYIVIPGPNPGAVTPGGTNQVLVRRITTNILAPTPVDPVEEILCKNVVAFTLSYYDGAAWTDTWDSTQSNNALPLAVQFELELAPLKPNGKPRLDTRTIPIPCADPSTAGAVGGLVP